MSSKCPACGAALAPEAVLCVHCGHDLRTGAQLAVTTEPVVEHVDVHGELVVRIVIAGVVGGLAMLLAVAHGPASILPLAVLVLIVALAVGTFTRLSAGRRPDGVAIVTRTRFVGFVPVRAVAYRPADYEALVTSYARGLAAWEWVVALLLFVLGVVPGIIWWWWAFSSQPI